MSTIEQVLQEIEAFPDTSLWTLVEEIWPLPFPEPLGVPKIFLVTLVTQIHMIHLFLNFLHKIFTSLLYLCEVKKEKYLWRPLREYTTSLLVREDLSSASQWKDNCWVSVSVHRDQWGRVCQLFNGVIIQTRLGIQLKEKDLKIALSSMH